MTINSILSFLSSNVIYLPIIVGLVYIRKLNSAYRLLFFLVVIGGIVENIYAKAASMSITSLTLNLYTIVETLLIALIYHKLSYSQLWKKLIIILTAIFCLYFFLNWFFFQGKNELNSISMGLECILMIILSAGMFHQLIINVPSNSFIQSEEFWFNFSVFMYFSLNIFIFLFSNSLFQENAPNFFGIRLWHIHSIANILFNSSFAVALWLAGKKQQTQ